jgi:hypothetical protein
MLCVYSPVNIRLAVGDDFTLWAVQAILEFFCDFTTFLSKSSNIL